MRTKSILALVALGFMAHPVLAAPGPRIDTINTSGLEILTATARPETGGVRVSGLARRDARAGSSPVHAHLDIRAFGGDGAVLATTIARLPRTASNLRHREAVRYQAVIPAPAVASASRIEVRYHPAPHAEDAAEVRP